MFTYEESAENKNKKSEEYAGIENNVEVDEMYENRQRDITALLGDKCRFSCLWCTFVCQSYFDYCQHVRGNHSDKISVHLLSDDAEAHSDILRLKKCHICKASLPYDSYSLFKHLMMKHRDHKFNWKQQISEQAAQIKPNSTKSQEQDFSNMQKCFVFIKMSKYVQSVKDDINKECVPFVARTNFPGTTAISDLCFEGQNLPVKATSEIGNLCLFECYKCNTNFDSCYGLTKHANQKHFRLPCDGTIRKLIKRSLKIARYHSCRVCNKTILCDLKYIDQHVSQHKIHMKDYMVMKTPNQLQSFKEKFVTIYDYRFSGQSLTTTESCNVPSESITTAVENLCLFQCDKCQGRFNNTSTFRHHLTKCKGNNKFDPKYVSKALFHKCRLCGLIMLCDKALLWRHLRATHAIALSDYSTTNLLKHMNEGKMIRDVQITPKNHLDLVPAVMPLERICNKKGSLADNLTTRMIGNLCLFACDICEFRSKLWGGMKNHNAYSNHGPGHSRFDPKYLKEARYHECKICEQVMLCDKSVIKNHIKNIHGIRLLEKYENLSVQEKEFDHKYQNDTKDTDDELSKKQSDFNSSDNNFQEEEHAGQLITKEFRNLSLFRCNTCRMQCNSYCSMKLHLSKCQGTWRVEKKHVMNSILHSCKICQKNVFCDKTIISSHVATNHKMSTTQYVSLLVQDQVKKEYKIKQLEGPGSSMESVKVFSSALPISNVNFGISKELLQDADTTSLVNNLCYFGCISCNFTSRNWPDLSLHIRVRHQKDKERIYFRSEYVKEAVYHKCYICEKGILCDEELIIRHIKKQHNIYLLKKYKRLGKIYKTKTHNSSAKVYAKCYTDLPAHVDQSMISNKTINACVFSCDKCPFTKSNWTEFRHHKRSVHSDARFEFDPKYVKSAKYYQCPLCETFTLCDRTIILCHLNRHKFRSIKKFDAWLEENKENRSIK